MTNITRLQALPPITNNLPNDSDKYKWYILGLVVLTNMLVVAMPTMGMSVLSKEISDTLNLSLTQVGVVWGIGTLAGIFTALYGGALGDRIGPKRILIVTSLLGGLIGAARGLAWNFPAMTAIVFAAGAITPIVAMNGIKTAGQWFPAHQMGLANGLISMGFALGFFLGSLLSATTFSPWLGGWRNVLIAYGLIGALFSIPWLFSKNPPDSQNTSHQQQSIGKMVSHVAKQKDIWLLGLALIGIGGCIQGILGYIPLYLRNLGWQVIAADGALSAFHTISMIFVLPVAFWSNKLGAHKQVLQIAGLIVVIGVALLSFVNGPMVWIAVLLVGSVRDAFMAVLLTIIIRTKNIGITYAGTATGFIIGLSGIGNAFAPPIGNSLAVFWPGAPFLFWSALALAGMFCLTCVKQPDPVNA